MTRTMRLDVGLVTCLAAFSGVADAFWRLPCRGRSGLARMDPLMDPGKPSNHVHAIHGASSFAMTVDEASLKESECTSCAVTQDKSAYWAPALYFMHENGDTEIVEQVGGMLAYYLLYGEKVAAFPEGFRMLAGDPFLRNFPWPIPDRPKSEWTGKQASQKSLRQKALGFNCLNYNKDAEPSLGRHYLPDKSYLDEHCTDGVRFEIMFPSCWNGKDSDSDDHQSHVAYPSLVMDGTCPEGYETRVISLFYETIWNTYAFKDKQGKFVLANGDPTGFGYHADFIHGWDSGILEQAVKRCTNPSGQITDCDVFDIQSESDQQKCKFEVPDVLKDEDVYEYKGSLPDGLAVQYGPAYASPVSYVSGHASATQSAEVSASLGVSLSLGGNAETTKAPQPTSTSTTQPTWTAKPSISYLDGTVVEEVVYIEKEITIHVDAQGNPTQTEAGPVETLSTATSTTTDVVSTIVSTPTAPPAKRDGHAHVHKRHRHGRHAH
ncbi:hypothetical protein P170DRAFT_422884 [Aspergillus steynii IBT 23096]|uniref:DUF1996 domain-containing protein n=1 Tax=Aspergillus steynii IBT 23096 TaxID=1392250 RepID=A0A2I2GGF1_9EURO|nr:uncharacterized protein P170DRAFT_422884 [Aspergillus steynii IBT 23096]PLB51955.1 hypothetical protein P170DRAFT_422884 [Aspergillus steynii IBT 23096]